MRIYEIDGRSLPSVTTILDATMPSGSRMKLDSWYTKPSALRQNAESMRRGNELDSWIKSFLHGTPPPPLDGLFIHYTRHLREILTRIKLEQPLSTDRVVHTQDYAGTIDCLTPRCLYEFKSKSRARIDPSSVHEAELQAIAYYFALPQLLRPPGICILFVTPAFCQHHHIPFERWEELEQAWQQRLAQYPGVMDQHDASL